MFALSKLQTGFVAITTSIAGVLFLWTLQESCLGLLKPTIEVSYGMNTSKREYMRSSERSVERTWKERNVVLRQGCRKLQAAGLLKPAPHLNSMWNVVINEKHKLIVCTVRKVASTTTLRWLLALTGYMDFDHAMNLPSEIIHMKGGLGLGFHPRFRNFTLKEIDYRIKMYKKVMVVRDPIERFLSAYMYLFERISNGSYSQNLVQNFMNSYNKAVVNNNTYTIRFPEFVTYVLDDIKHEGKLNSHWDLVQNMCRPCHIPYDVIVKYETMEEDMNQLFKVLNVEHIVHFPSRSEAHYTGPKTEKSMVEYFKQVPKEDLKSLWQFYSRDAELFGYRFPQILDKYFGN